MMDGLINEFSEWGEKRVVVRERLELSTCGL
jgi:hypothetical protein